MLEAYQITLRDFEIALRHTPWYHFKAINNLSNLMEEYEKKIDKFYLERGDLDLDNL